MHRPGNQRMHQTLPAPHQQVHALARAGGIQSVIFGKVVSPTGFEPVTY